MNFKFNTKLPKWFPNTITIDLFWILIVTVTFLGISMVLVPHQINDFTIRLLGGLFLLFVYLVFSNRIKQNKNDKGTETGVIEKL